MLFQEIQFLPQKTFRKIPIFLRHDRVQKNQDEKISRKKSLQSIAGDLPYNVVVARKFVARRQKIENRELRKVTF